MAWTDERIARLKHGWESGMTATQIAEMLGEGVTRNAVIGKAHRLGLESRPSPVKAADAAATPSPQPAPTAPAARPTPAPQAVPAATAAAMADAVAPAPVAARPVAKAAKAGKQALTTLLDLNEKVCKWPLGHPGDADFHFCGRPSQASFPYCTEHCLLAYQAQMPRRDRPRQLPTMPSGPRR